MYETPDWFIILAWNDAIRAAATGLRGRQ
jgi:hypothetical protein